MPAPDFVDSSEAILPFFDHLGPVFSVARHEFDSKLSSLRGAALEHSTLGEIVRADRARGAATAKNSRTRNLHRLAAAIAFVKILFERLMRAPGAPLREAAGEAYEATLAPFHTMLIRGAVRAGMLTLPSREHFLAAIGETEESAAPRCEDVIASCSSVIVVVERLLDGIDFPVSDVWFWPS
ncbi:MAG: glycolipid transfer protein [Monoraphidium minutum]|nr:MAG: glycolipid transfer protein [Monoraphidium minutum]